jgi:hypothetical protein
MPFFSTLMKEVSRSTELSVKSTRSNGATYQTIMLSSDVA